MKKTATLKKLFLPAVLACCLLLAYAGRSLADTGYAGGDKCKECHDGLVGSFRSNIHSKAAFYGAKNAGCESCHGPAAAHVEAGDKAKIRNPAKLAAEASSAACFSCHGKDKGRMFWKGSVHDS